VEHADIVAGLGLDYVALHCYNGTANLEAVAKNLSDQGIRWSLEEFPTKADAYFPLLNAASCRA